MKRGACGSDQDMAAVVVCSLLHSALPQPGFSPRVKSTTQRRARHLEQSKPAERRRAHATFRGSAATYHTLCIRAWGKGGVEGGEVWRRVAYLRLAAIATWQAKWAEDTHCRPLKPTPRPRRRPRTGMTPYPEVFGSWFSYKSVPSYSLLVRRLPTRPTLSDIRFAWSSSPTSISQVPTYITNADRLSSFVIFFFLVSPLSGLGLFVWFLPTRHLADPRLVPYSTTTTQSDPRRPASSFGSRLSAADGSRCLTQWASLAFSRERGWETRHGQSHSRQMSQQGRLSLNKVSPIPPPRFLVIDRSSYNTSSGPPHQSCPRGAERASRIQQNRHGVRSVTQSRRPSTRYPSGSRRQR